MGRLRDLTGEVFGDLTVLEYAGASKWKCLCRCGKVSIVSSPCLIRDKTKSCGCRRHSNKSLVTHGMTDSREYRSWCSMKARCLNPSSDRYFLYGARGITISADWLDFSNFFKDMGPRLPGMTLERIDNNMGYSKVNCKWATRKEQARNTRKTVTIIHKGIPYKSKALLAEFLGITSKNLEHRLSRGWSEEDLGRKTRGNGLVGGYRRVNNGD